MAAFKNANEFYVEASNVPRPHPLNSRAAAPKPRATPLSQSRPVYTQQPTTNGLAVASLVFSLVWVFGVGSIVALFLGYPAIREIDQSGGRESGREIAVAAVVLGWIGLVPLVIVAVIAILAAFGHPASTQFSPVP
jgi:Domain of unknown function (DUF4190)